MEGFSEMIELSNEKINELFERLSKVKHRIARVAGDMEKEKVRAEEAERQGVQSLMLAITEVLNIVEFVYKQNDRRNNDGKSVDG